MLFRAGLCVRGAGRGRGGLFAQSAAARALGPRSRVLVKPNLVAKHAPEKAVTTHPAVLDAVCAALRRRGVESITVADSPGGLYNPAVMKSIYKASGLLAVCERHGALAYTACEAAPRKTDGVRVKEFSLLRPVLEADFIIDLPKVKTHVMTGMSCAVKNLFGTVPGLQKAEFHMRFPEKEPFGEMLVDLCETVRPQLIIADGVLAMEGDGPAGGTPRALGLVLGGGGQRHAGGPCCGCRLMGMPAMRVPYLGRRPCPRLVRGGTGGSAAARRHGRRAAPVADYKLPAGFADISFADKAPRALRWAVPGRGKVACPAPEDPPEQMHRLRQVRRDMPRAHHHSGKRKGAYRAEGLHPLFLLPRDVPRKGHRCEAGWDIQSVDGKRQK